MVYVPAIPDWFQTRKAAQVVAFFAVRAGGKINILRATKLVYLADRRSIDQRDHPITNDNYASMPFGPVNSYTYSYIDGAAAVRQDQWLEFISPRNKNDIPLSREVTIEEDLDELSRSDLRILEETWAEFKDIDRFELAEWTHKYCPEWKDPNGSSIPIDLATIFASLNKEDPVALAEDLQDERRTIAAQVAA
ncbi:Panacea domain-containing protein [Phyllobacterium sp. K27]